MIQGLTIGGRLDARRRFTVDPRSIPEMMSNLTAVITTHHDFLDNAPF